MEEKKKEEIKNVIDYLYGMWRDIDMFLKEHGKSKCNEEYKTVSSNLLARLKYQLEQAQKMLKKVIGEEDGKA